MTKDKGKRKEKKPVIRYSNRGRDMAGHVAGGNYNFPFAIDKNMSGLRVRMDDDVPSMYWLNGKVWDMVTAIVNVTGVENVNLSGNLMSVDVERGLDWSKGTIRAQVERIIKQYYPDLEITED